MNTSSIFPGMDEAMPAYHNLVWEAWVPIVRLAVQRWQSRQPDPLIGIIMIWQGYMKEIANVIIPHPSLFRYNP